MDRAHARALQEIASDWDEVGQDLKLPGGQVSAGATPGSSMTISINGLAPWKLVDGDLKLMAKAGTDGFLQQYAAQLVERLAALGHQVTSISVVTASDLELEFARELIDVAAR